MLASGTVFSCDQYECKILKQAKLDGPGNVEESAEDKARLILNTLSLC